MGLTQEKGIMITHIDEAPWVRGEPTPPGGPRRHGSQFIGDRERGPWISVISLLAGSIVDPHAHTLDEIFFILEGAMIFQGRSCGPGTVVSIQAETQYDFTVGKDGVRYMKIRNGIDMLIKDGEITDNSNIIPTKFQEA